MVQPGGRGGGESSWNSNHTIDAARFYTPLISMKSRFSEDLDVRRKRKNSPRSRRSDIKYVFRQLEKLSFELVTTIILILQFSTKEIKDGEK